VRKKEAGTSTARGGTESNRAQGTLFITTSILGIPNRGGKDDMEIYRVDF